MLSCRVYTEHSGQRMADQRLRLINDVLERKAARIFESLASNQTPLDLGLSHYGVEHMFLKMRPIADRPKYTFQGRPHILFEDVL